MNNLNIYKENPDFLHAGESSDLDNFELTYFSKGSYYLKRSLPVNKLSLSFTPSITDILLGYVLTIRENFAIVQSEKIIGSNTKFTSVYFLPISEIKQSFVKDIKLCLKPHDLILFKIIDLEKQRITIKENDLGVVYSTCIRCNNILKSVVKNHSVCQVCGVVNTRKFSDKYGQNFNI
jgi:exosome complex RNA-binding protein Csl4